MSKIYFAKLLPVKEKIKEGDWYWNEEDELMQATCHPDFYACRDLKKGKLFLCSRDITFGGNIMWEKSDVIFESLSRNRDEGRINLSGIKNNRKINISPLESECFKIIGKISPQAIWVKEEDEFNKDQTRFSLYSKDNHIHLDTVDTIEQVLDHGYYIAHKDTTIIVAEIKGPCSHFH